MKQIVQGLLVIVSGVALGVAGVALWQDDFDRATAWLLLDIALTLASLSMRKDS